MEGLSSVAIGSHLSVTCNSSMERRRKPNLCFFAFANTRHHVVVRPSVFHLLTPTIIHHVCGHYVKVVSRPVDL